jgi:hypothetical protein
MVAAFTTDIPSLPDLGRTAAAGAGIDSCSAHDRRICGEGAVDGGGRDLLLDGEEAKLLAVGC